MATQKISISLSVDEMVYDIHNKTYLTGRSLEGGTDQAVVAHMETNDDEGETNQILRSLSDNFAKLLVRLSEYMELPSNGADNVLPTRSQDYVVTLTMPSNYNTAANADIARAMGEYMVDMSLRDWFALTYPNAAKTYEERANACIAEINLAAHRRVRPLRDVSATSPDTEVHAIDGVRINNTTTSDDIGLLKDSDVSVSGETLKIDN